MEVAVKKARGLWVCAHLARKVAVSGIAHWSCNREGPLGLISRSHHPDDAVFAWATGSSFSTTNAYSTSPLCPPILALSRNVHYPTGSLNTGIAPLSRTRGWVRVDLTSYRGKYAMQQAFYEYRGAHNCWGFNYSLVGFGKAHDQVPASGCVASAQSCL